MYYRTEYYAVLYQIKHMYLEHNRILSCNIPVLIPRIGTPNSDSHLLPSFSYIFYPEPFLFSTDFSSCYTYAALDVRLLYASVAEGTWIVQSV